MTKSHAKRFVGAAWAMLSFQLVASVGAVAVTGLAAMHVSRIAAELDATRGQNAREQAPAVEEVRAGDETNVADAGRDRITTDERPSIDQAQQQGPVATPAPAIAACTRSDGIIRVPANVEWCDTGINVRRGQRIAISAQGRWNYRSEPAFGPAGSGERIDTTLLPRAPLAALIGRVGNEVFLVGQGGQSQAASEGRLYLSINDVSGTFGDNSGFMDVYVQFPEESRR